MSENQNQKQQQKGKGLGRGLGSLLGSTNEGAFSRTTSGASDKTIEALKKDLPSSSEPAIKAGFVDKAEAPKPAPVAAAKPAAPAPAPASAKAAAPAGVAAATPPKPVTQAAPAAAAPVAAKPAEPQPAAPAAAPAPAAPAPAAPVVPAHMRIWSLAIEKVQPNPKQPRQIFDKEALQELADSIKEKGIIQPLLVRKIGLERFEIIAGERRWRAAQLAGLKEVPAILKDSEDQEVLELALIENIQRENLNALEEAEAYEFLIKKYNLTQQELAQKVGKDRATVANMLRILQLQPGVRQMVSNGELSLGQAKVLLSVSEGRKQEELAHKARSESLSVRALEKLVAKARFPERSAPDESEDPRTQAARALGEELQKLVGSKVVLDYDRGKGRIVIHYYSDLELNQIADTLRDSWRN